MTLFFVFGEKHVMLGAQHFQLGCPLHLMIYRLNAWTLDFFTSLREFSAVHSAYCRAIKLLDIK